MNKFLILSYSIYSPDLSSSDYFLSSTHQKIMVTIWELLKSNCDEPNKDFLEVVGVIFSFNFTSIFWKR